MPQKSVVGFAAVSMFAIISVVAGCGADSGGPKDGKAGPSAWSGNKGSGDSGKGKGKGGGGGDDAGKGKGDGTGTAAENVDPAEPSGGAVGETGEKKPVVVPVVDPIPKPNVTMPALDLGFEASVASFSMNYLSVFSAYIGLVDGETWRGLPLGVPSRPKLMSSSGNEVKWYDRPFQKPLDLALADSSCVLDETTPLGGVKKVLLRCKDARFPLETYDQGQGSWLDLEVRNLKSFSASESLACVHDEAGFKCYGTRPGGFDQQEIANAIELPAKVPDPISFKVSAHTACAVHVGTGGEQELTCMGRDIGTFTGFDGRTFLRGEGYSTCVINGALNDMTCGYRSRLPRGFRAKLGLATGGRIEDAYHGDSAECLRVGRKVGCTSGIQEYPSIVVSLPEEWDVSKAGSFKLVAGLDLSSKEATYSICFQNGPRLLCDETPRSAFPADATDDTVLEKVGDFQDKVLEKPKSVGVEWYAPVNKNRLGCIEGSIFFMPASNIGAARELGYSRSMQCSELVPQPDLLGGAYLLKERVESPYDRIEALAESKEDLPSTYEQITFIPYHGARKNITAPGLTRTSQVVSAGNSGALYYVAHRPKSTEGAVTAKCSNASMHPGCAAKVSFRSTVYRLKPNADGSFPVAAEELYEGENVVEISLSKDEKTLHVRKAESFKFENDAYVPVNPTLVKADIIDLGINLAIGAAK